MNIICVTRRRKLKESKIDVQCVTELSNSVLQWLLVSVRGILECVSKKFHAKLLAKQECWDSHFFIAKGLISLIGLID
uniref:Uncharacterized protein n=1 Tax=Octopus bimaculoides TaxID=37653 RepID=A0A0L8I1B7_OCTBM